MISWIKMPIPNHLQSICICTKSGMLYTNMTFRSRNNNNPKHYCINDEGYLRVDWEKVDFWAPMYEVETHLKNDLKNYKEKLGW